jgi:hypothetical protein
MVGFFRRRVKEPLEAAAERTREALGGRRRRWRAVPPPPGALGGGQYVLLRGCTDPIPEWLAGAEFEPDPEPTVPAGSVQWRRSTFWEDRRRQPSRYDWRPL